MAPLYLPYTAREVALLLGMSMSTFYRRYAGLVRDDHMPASIAHGHYKFERMSMDAWLGRHHPQSPPLQHAANDTAPERHLTDDEERKLVQAEYGRSGRKAAAHNNDDDNKGN